ncbi:FecR family protein [Sphingobacterium faecale]|uniref:DUF4974 domain-containing protein n=1 Tax=Sphingobacterium faecale TaxID=2803775 RepID=A0ABS1R7H9_9SPHI|nr:FecR domain-containing protein [Sphingobacterium faecale]MBL1409811.1 DUF4974 domain-containing protein [Sphingobacterium faecale]
MSCDNDYFLKLVELYMTRRITDEEYQQLARFLRKHEQNRLFFENVVNSTLPLSNVETAFEKLKQKMPDQPRRKKNTIFRLSVWKYAAAVILLMFVFAAVIYSSREKTDISLVYQAPLGKRLHYALPDGSQVWLNGGSSLKLEDRFGENDRRVTLLGEAYFDVKHDSHKPFLVNADELHIKVVGTTFNVRAYPDEVWRETTLLSGRVELTVDAVDRSEGNIEPKTYTMSPGEKVSVNKNQSGVVDKKDIKEQEGLQNSAVWKDNVLVFENDPMPYVQSKLEKWYGVKIEIRNEELIHNHFSGKFKETSIEEVLKLLKETGGIKSIRKEQDAIIIE